MSSINIRLFISFFHNGFNDLSITLLLIKCNPTHTRFIRRSIHFLMLYCQRSHVFLITFNLGVIFSHNRGWPVLCTANDSNDLQWPFLQVAYAALVPSHTQRNFLCFSFVLQPQFPKSLKITKNTVQSQTQHCC